jgi:hypothetical protein
MIREKTLPGRLRIVPNRQSSPKPRFAEEQSESRAKLKNIDAGMA